MIGRQVVLSLVNARFSQPPLSFPSSHLPRQNLRTGFEDADTEEIGDPFLLMEDRKKKTRLGPLVDDDADPMNKYLDRYARELAQGRDTRVVKKPGKVKPKKPKNLIKKTENVEPKKPKKLFKKMAITDQPTSSPTNKPTPELSGSRYRIFPAIIDCIIGVIGPGAGGATQRDIERLLYPQTSDGETLELWDRHVNRRRLDETLPPYGEMFDGETNELWGDYLRRRLCEREQKKIIKLGIGDVDDPDCIPDLPLKWIRKEVRSTNPNQHFQIRVESTICVDRTHLIF
jgi:hypothetical protein